MTIQRMCVFLDALCSDDYLNTVSKKIFRDESRTRYNVVWTNDHNNFESEGDYLEV